MDQKQFEEACGATLLLLKKAYKDGELNAARREGHETSPEHLAWMLVMAALFHNEERKEKAHRWLGFVQGSMAADGYASVEELKRCNMPEGAAFDGGRI